MFPYLTHLLRSLNNGGTQGVSSSGEGSLPVVTQVYDARQEIRDLMQLADDGCPNVEELPDMPWLPASDR